MDWMAFAPGKTRGLNDAASPLGIFERKKCFPHSPRQRKESEQVHGGLMTRLPIHYLGRSLPVCPIHHDLLPDITHPSLFFVYSIICIVSFIFSFVTSFQYNSVRVSKKKVFSIFPLLNPKIRTQNISNTLWIVYYAVICLRFLMQLSHNLMDTVVQQVLCNMP
jgi:hypothetical protein